MPWNKDGSRKKSPFYKMKGFSGFGNESPVKHKGDGNHPEHHDDDYFEGTTRKVIDIGEDVVRKTVKTTKEKGEELVEYTKEKVKKAKKDPIGAVSDVYIDVAKEYVKPYKSAYDWLKKKFD